MKHYLSTYKDLSLYTKKELQELLEWAEDEICAWLEFRIKIKTAQRYGSFKGKSIKKQTKKETKEKRPNSN